MKKTVSISIILLFVTLSCVPVSAKKVVQKKADKATVSVPDQRKLDYYFYEAVKQRQQGNYAQAVDLLTECYYINPSNAGVANEFSLIYTAMGDVSRAMQFMLMATNLNPDNSWYKMGYAELCIKNNEFNKAIAVYEDIVRNHKEQEKVFYMLASLYRQIGDLKKSIYYLDKVEEKIGVVEELSFEKYRLYKALGKDKKAINEIQQLIKKHPYELKYQLLLAGVYLEDKKPQQALDLLKDLEKKNPENGVVSATLYAYYLAVNDSVSARMQFSKTMQDAQIDVEDKIRMLTQFMSQENQSVIDAENYLQELLSQYPENELLHSYYASFLLIQERNYEAESELRKLIQLNPQSKEPWMELIKLYASQDSTDRMIVTIDEAIENFPDENSFYYYRGLAFIHQKEYEKAIEAYKVGLEKTGQDDRYIVLLLTMSIADLYAEMKNMDEAFVYYEKAYQLDPNNILLLNNYAYYLSLAEKDLAKAEEMSGKTVQAYPNEPTYLDTYAWVFFKQKNYVLAKMYILQAIDKGGINNDVILEHCGDILYFNGETDDAVEYWEKSKDAGNESTVLLKKIETRTYIKE